MNTPEPKYTRLELEILLSYNIHFIVHFLLCMSFTFKVISFDMYVIYEDHILLSNVTCHIFCRLLNGNRLSG